VNSLFSLSQRERAGERENADYSNRVLLCGPLRLGVLCV
jgi:hypothetical protein